MAKLSPLQLKVLQAGAAALDGDVGKIPTHGGARTRLLGVLLGSHWIESANSKEKCMPYFRVTAKGIQVLSDGANA